MGFNSGFKGLNSHLTEYALRFHYKDHSVNSVEGNDPCLLRESCETHKAAVRKKSAEFSGQNLFVLIAEG